MIPIAKPILGKEEEKAVLDVLHSGNLAQGKKVEEFEKDFAKYCGVKHAIATSNGTTALQLALMSIDIHQGDEVITTPFSFIATANSVVFCGGNPIFADIEADSFNITPEEIRKCISQNTKAIMPVHLFGNPAKMDEIREIAEMYDLYVIEDACQAHGAEIKGKKVGSFGDLAAFSFYSTKNMTSGEGGMVTTDDAELADLIRKYRNHGQSERYKHGTFGFNFRMTDICAAIGVEQLKKLDDFNSQRIWNARILSEALFDTPELNTQNKHVFNQYTLKRKDRDEVMARLTKSGVGTGIYYPIPINEQEYYRSLGYASDTPISSRLAKEVFSVPIHPSVSEDDLQVIIKALK